MSCMCLLVLGKQEDAAEETADRILAEEGFCFFRGERMSWIPAFVQKQVNEQTFVVSIADDDQYDNCKRFVSPPLNKYNLPDYNAYEVCYARFGKAVRTLLNAGFSCKMYLTDDDGAIEEDYEYVTWQPEAMARGLRYLNEARKYGGIVDLCIDFIP